VDRGVGEGRRGGLGARRATRTTELPETKAKKNALVVSNDAVKKQLQDGTKKMTDEPPEGLRANLRPAYLQAVLRRQAGLHHQAPFEYKELLRGFSDTDYDISKEWLELFLDEYEEGPYK